MSDRKFQNESREDALERILAETAKNPYTPKRPVRPAQKNQPVSHVKETPAERIPQTASRPLTEAQKAEEAKARAAKKMEEIRLARQREAQQTSSIPVRRENPVGNTAFMQRAVSEERTVQMRVPAAQKKPAQVRSPYPEEKTVQMRVPVQGQKPAEMREYVPEERMVRRREPVQRNIPQERRVHIDDTGYFEAYEPEVPSDSRSITLNDILDIAESAIAVILVILMIFTYIIRIAEVDGESMKPTLEDNDRLIVRSIGYTPEDGDVIVINNEKTHLISENGKVTEGDGLDKTIVKRVIAKGGQTVDIDFENGIVSVDGMQLEEKYISEPTTRDEYAFTYPLTVPEGYLFVMGDNRNLSMDSRHPQIGLVPEDSVVGKVVFRVYPFGKFGGID